MEQTILMLISLPAAMVAGFWLGRWTKKCPKIKPVPWWVQLVKKHSAADKVTIDFKNETVFGTFRESLRDK
jgi:hypothetical protein